MVSLVEETSAFYPLAYCKDLADSLPDVLEHESSGYLVGRAVYEFFQEFTGIYHRFAVDLAKTAKITQSVLATLSNPEKKRDDDSGGSFMSLCVALPALMMQLAQAHSVTAQQVSQHTLAPLQKYEDSARTRLAARREQVVCLTASLEQEKKAIEDGRSFANQTLVKLAKTNMQKDKKAWLRRRNKAIERLEDYKSILINANRVAADLRMNQLSDILLQMQEEEELRSTQVKVALSSFAFILGRTEPENNVESAPAIAQKLAHLVDSFDPASDLTQFVHTVGVVNRKHAISQKISDGLAQASAQCDKDELVSLSGPLTRAPEVQSPTSGTRSSSSAPIAASPTASIVADTAKVMKVIHSSAVSPRSEPAVAAKRPVTSGKSPTKEVVETDTTILPIAFSFPYEISTPKDLWGAVSERATKQACMFFSSLEGVMEHQERCFPKLHTMSHDTPIILDVLIKATGHFGAGLLTKRVCAPASWAGTTVEDRLLAMQVQTLQEQYESGNFRFTMSSALVPGVLLQRWLMGLAEPLIPYSCFAEAINLTKDSTSTQEATERISALLSKLPLVHWKVLDRVLDFIMDVEHCSSSNEMSRKLLAQSFAPCILRAHLTTSKNNAASPETSVEFLENLLQLFCSPKWRSPEAMKQELAEDLAVYGDVGTVSQRKYPPSWNEKLETCLISPASGGLLFHRASFSSCTTPGCMLRKLRRGYCLNHVKVYVKELSGNEVTSNRHRILGNMTSWEIAQEGSRPMDAASTEKSRKVLEELKTTEETYVRCLNILNEKWVMALEKPTEPHWIKAMAKVSKADVGFLVEHIATLANFHNIFISEVKQLSNLDQISTVFLKYASYFKMYTSYMNSFDTRLSTLARLRTSNKRFGDVIKQIEETLRGSGLDLASYLIMPVQRVPRYVLLLKELTKNTPSNHPEYRNHMMALEKFKGIASHINSAKAEAEALAKLMQIQNKIQNLDFELVQPHRQLVKEGGMTLVSSGTILSRISKPKPVFVFLFNDVVVWTNQRHRNMKGKMLLTSTTSAIQLDNGDIEIVSNNEVLVVHAPDTTERKAWIDVFQEVVREQRFISANKQVVYNRRVARSPTATLVKGSTDTLREMSLSSDEKENSRSPSGSTSAPKHISDKELGLNSTSPNLSIDGGNDDAVDASFRKSTGPSPRASELSRNTSKSTPSRPPPPPKYSTMQVPKR